MTGNHSHPEMIWGARNIPQAALLKLMILYTGDGCLRESLEVPKGSQANPWDYPDKNTGAGCHFLLQGIFLTQGLNPCLLHLPRWQPGSFTTGSPGGQLGDMVKPYDGECGSYAHSLACTIFSSHQQAWPTQSCPPSRARRGDSHVSPAGTVAAGASGHIQRAVRPSCQQKMLPPQCSDAQTAETHTHLFLPAQLIIYAEK